MPITVIREGEVKFIVARVTGDPALKAVALVDAEQLKRWGLDRVSQINGGEGGTQFRAGSTVYKFPPGYIFAYTPHSVVALSTLTNEETALPFSHEELRTPKKTTPQ